jgi:hypothetical protein
MLPVFKAVVISLINTEQMFLQEHYIPQNNNSNIKTKNRNNTERKIGIISSLFLFVLTICRHVKENIYGLIYSNRMQK